MEDYFLALFAVLVRNSWPRLLLLIGPQWMPEVLGVYKYVENC